MPTTLLVFNSPFPVIQQTIMKRPLCGRQGTAHGDKTRDSVLLSEITETLMQSARRIPQPLIPVQYGLR